MIDAYKQVLVGQYETPKATENVPDLTDDPDVRKALDKGNDSKDASAKENGTDQAAEKNSTAEGTKNAGAQKEADTLEYGSGKASITEFYLTDHKGVRTTAILKGNTFTMHMKVKIHEDLEAPIFAFSIKNVKGVELTGTNTMFEKSFLESVKAGETKEITFTQRMLLQGGDYLVSLGVTGYEKDTFTVYHRLYDVLSLTVVSDKNTVGYFDMESTIEVKDVL